MLSIALAAVMLIPEPLPSVKPEISAPVLVHGELHYRAACETGESNPASTRSNSLGGPFIYIVDSNGAFVGDPVVVSAGRFWGPGLTAPGLYYVNVIYEDKPWFFVRGSRSDMVAFEVTGVEEEIEIPKLCLDADGPRQISFFDTQPEPGSDVVVGLVTRKREAYPAEGESR